jgi:hypothetical protein
MFVPRMRATSPTSKPALPRTEAGVKADRR